VVTQVFERRERRYIVADPSATMEALLASKFEHRAYGVRTLYLPAASISKLRLREYDGSNVWWLEHKKRRKDFVTKVRHRLGALDVPGLDVRADVTYWRNAFDGEGVRVTVDERLGHGQTVFPGAIIEVKGSATRALALDLPPKDKLFSKFRWATGAYCLDDAFEGPST